MASATYPIAVAVCLWTRSLKYLWATAGAIAILTMVSYMFGPPPTPDVYQAVLVNHVATLATTLVVASLVHHAICSHRAIDTQRGIHAAQNTVLEQLNLELTQGEEEVIRQKSVADSHFVSRQRHSRTLG